MNNREKIKIFKALANERRFAILGNLFKLKELHVGAMSELIGLSFKSTSRHLSVLMNSNLVVVKQVNLNRFYSINPHFPREFKIFFGSFK